MHATILNLSLSLSKLQVSNSKLCMHVMYDYDSVPTPRLQAPTKPKQSTGGHPMTQGRYVHACVY